MVVGKEDEDSESVFVLARQTSEQLRTLSRMDEWMLVKIIPHQWKW